MVFSDLIQILEIIIEKLKDSIHKTISPRSETTPQGSNIKQLNIMPLSEYVKYR